MFLEDYNPNFTPIKTQFLTLVSFIFYLTLAAQTYQKYPTQNGIPSIFPSTTVKQPPIP